MSDKQCPAEAELLAFADADLSPERLERVEKHLERCGACAKQAAALSELIGDLASPLAQPRFDVAEHVASVTKRLDSPVKSAHDSRRTAWGGGFAAAIAAAAALAVFARGTRPGGPPEHFEARGGAAEAGLSRDVGVQLYARDPSLRALEPGGRVRAGTALTAGLRNLARGPAYLLLFAIDSKREVHWLAPEFTSAGTDPEAMVIASSPGERLLPQSAAFDDLAPGRLRVVAVISSEPTHVSEVEGLPAVELDAFGLAKRFPRAEIREFMLEALP
ncbi:MAG TPA: zf-HC2 domain-containing protein [Polyangiaceae bacterium]|nr:zf-HC2 domain-containing protein [Polyangiaceae bacterium]